MADFNDFSLFDNHAVADQLFTGGGTSTVSKFDAVLAASKEKVKKLDELRQLRELNKQSLIGEFSQGGVLDTAVATLASPITQTGNVLAGALEMHNDANETDPIAAAQTRLAAKKIREAMNMDHLVGINPDTGERTSSLHRRTLGNAAVLAAQGSAAAVQGIVGLGSLVSGGRVGQLAEEAGFRPTDGIAILEEFLTPEMRAINKQVDAADGFSNTVNEMLDNPSSIAAGIIKSVPSMLMGGAIGKGVGLVKGVSSGVAGALGEGAIMAGSQAEGIREQTADGRLTLKQALLAAGTGVMGAGVGVVGNKLAGALRIGDLDEAVVTGALTKSPRGAFTRTLLSGGVEGGEELLQSTGETIAQNVALGKPFDQGVGDAAAMGLMTGAPMGAVSGLVSGAEQSREAKVAERVQHDAAIQANDTSAYLDPKSPQHSPVAAMEVLLGHAQLDTATPEVKTANYTKSKEVLSSLEDGLQHAKIVASILQSDKEDIPAINERVAALKAEIVELDQANPEAAMQKRATLAAFEEGLVTKVTPSNIKKQVRDVARRVAELENVRRVQKNLSELVIGKADADTVVSDLATAKASVVSTDQPAVLASQQAAERLINLSMVSPEHLDEATAVSLANDTQNGLSAPQREYLRQFSAARVAQNQLETDESVANTILYGDKKGNLGLKDYKRYIGTAVATGDKTTTIRYMDMLQSFALDHTQKAKVVGEAMVKAIQQGKSLQVIREHGSNGVWALAREGKTYRQSQVTDMGGFVAHPNSEGSRRLADRMPTEATALNQALAAHVAAYQLKFNEAPKGIRLPVVSKTTTQPVASTPSVAPTTAAPSSATPVVSAKTQSSVESAASPTTESKSVEESAEVESRPEQTTDANQENTQKTEEGKQHSVKTESGSEAAAVSESGIGSTEKITDEPAEAWVDHAVVKKAIKQAEHAYKRAIKANPSSLWTVLKHSLNEVDLSDIYGSDWKKRYTMLKSATAGSLSTRVANGQLDEFLPHNLRFGTGYSTSIDLEGDAVEHIKEKLRSRDYLTEDTHNVLKQLDMDIQQLYAALTLEDIQREIDFAEAQITNDSQASKPEAATTPTEESVGSVVEPASHEAAGFKDAQPVKVPTTEGVLSIFSQYVKDPFAAIEGKVPTVSEVFKTVNLVAQYFKQSGVNETNLTNRPLAAIKNFLTAWENKIVSVKDYLDLGKEGTLSDEQKSALKNMAHTMKSWFPAIQGNFKKFTGNMDFRMEDMMQYLYTEGGVLDVDENVKTAIGYAAYHWIVDKANSPMLLTDEQISEMHAQDKSTKISPEGVKVLQRMSSYQHTAIADLGKVAVQALGLKLRDDAPVDLLPRLESALGVHVLALLENTGYAKTLALPASQVNGYFDEEMSSEFSEFTTYNYVQFVLQQDGNKLVHTDAVRAIKDANFGAGDVVTKLFGITKAPRMPATEPTKFVQGTAKDSKQDIPKVQRKAVQDTMNTPHTVIPGMWAAADKLGREAILKIAGFKDIESGKYHKENRRSIDAQNRNLENQFDLMAELLHQPTNKEGLEQAFYVMQSVWKNFRAGFSNQGLNLQTSKIHRFMFARPSWTVNIDMSNQALVDEFLISIAMALGVKTDQQRNSKTMDIFMAKLANEPKILEAVRVLQKGLEQGKDEVFTTKNIELVQEVASNAEGMMSLQAMLAFAKYLQAKETNQDNFEVTLLVGADGKTNGPMLTLLALGAAEFDTLNRGGFYSTEDGQATHFSEYFEGVGAMDLYQDLGMSVLTSVKTKVTTTEEIQKLHKQKRSKFAYTLSTREEFAAFQVLTKTLEKDGKVTGAMRNLTKTPLTSFFFGSSLGSSVKGMENAFIEGYYTAIEDLAQGKRTDGTTLKRFIEATNVLLVKSKGAPISTTLDVEQLLELSLTKAQEKALRRSFNVVMGASVKTAMTEYFDTFIGRRDALNKTIQAAYETYAAVYAEAYNSELDSLMEAGKIAYRTVSKGKDAGKKVPLHGLTVAQEKVLRLRIANIIPVMHTAYSLEEDNIRAGVYMAKTEVDKSKSPLYANTIYTQGGNIGTQSHTRIEVSPGVAGLPYSMHSLDSAVMHTALNAVPETMNVHDEGANGVDKIGGSTGVAHALNQATIEKLLEYSPAREAVVMLERLVTGLADRIAKGTSSPSVAKDMLARWYEVLKRNMSDEDMAAIEDVGMEMLRRSVENAYAADYARLTKISQMASVDQYTWEGGQFTVTPAIRDRAVFLRDQLEKSASPEFQKAIKDLQKAIKGTVETPAPVDASANMESVTVPADPLPTEPFAAWGETVKTPNDLHETDMLSLFDAKDVLPAKEVIAALVKRFQKTPKSAMSRFYLQLLGQISKAVPANLSIQMVHPETHPLTVLDSESVAVDKSRGWYSLRGRKESIYVMGPEFKHSGVTAEVLVHELLHAALAGVIGNVKASGGTAAAKALYQELDTLRNLAIGVASRIPDMKGYVKILSGFKGVDELISYGMSNREFQEKVLMKVVMDTRTTSVVTGMASFIKAITKFFFRDKSKENQAMTGMAVLLANVSGLFAEALKPEEYSQNHRDIQLSMAAQINSFSTLDIHDALDEGKLTPEFNAHLRNVLSNIVERLHGPFGSFREATMKTTANTALGVINEALATGQAPFTSELQASGFKFNNQTFFAAEQVEATVKAVLATKDGKLSAVMEELRNLEAEVRSKLTPQSFYKGDWFQATKDEREEATNLYNYLFKKVDGDYLARFAALGLTHEGFNALLKMPTKRAPAVMADRSAGNMLNRVFDKILEAANGKLTHTKAGQAADAKLASLVRQLVEIENRRKAVLKSPTTGIMSFMDAKAKATRQGAKDTVSTLMNSSMFKKNKNNVIAGTSALVDVVASGRTRAMFQNLLTMRNSAYQGTHGVVASAISEMNGPGKSLLKLLREGKAHLEGTRKKIISYTNKGVLESFADAGAYLTEEAKIALTRVLLRTGSHVLLDHFDMKQLEKLVTNPTELAKEIANFEAKLTGLSAEQLSFVIKKSKALGYHLVTNKTVVEDMLKNANNIAHMYTSIYQGKVSDSKVAEITPIIDSLTSLYALSYTKHADRVELGKVLATENARTDKGNGVEMALLTHKTAEAESKDRLFKDSEVLMMKGYIPEIYNPHTDIKAATAEEGKVLLNLGYKLVSELSLDPNDPYREPRALYVMRDGGLRPWLSGIFSFTGMRAKGTKHHGERAHGTQTVLARNAGTGKVKPGEGQAFDPTADHPNYMAPLLNADGVAVNYQYLMQARTKDVLLERTNQFDEVLGVLAGNIFDKEKSSEHNKKAVQLLYDDFKEGFTKKSASFLAVGPDSTNPELREIYRMLPKKTKDDIRAIWGKDEMLVRVENLDVVFGYRKLSLSTIFEKDITEQDAIDKALIWFVTKTMKHTGMVFKGMTPAQADQYSKSSAVVVRRGEQVWQEIVREVKDIYVVKNIVTSVNNFKSNLITLGLYGVGVTSGIRDMRIAWVAAEEHQRDSDLLFKLEQQIATGYVKGDVSEIQLEIARLKLALENNPVSEMIAAGLMPTIVEDVSTEDDAYSYKTAFTKKMEKYTNKLNPNVKDVAKNIAMTHDTKMYKSLSRIVQLSDFVARYALYQHLITRKDEPLAKEAALHEASEAFINYDVPMHREFQFMDDMGFFMFTKYFLRAQRVIRGRIKHAPGKLAALLLAESYIGDLPTIIDSSILVRAGNNPLHAGAIQIVGAAGELAPIKMATSLFDY